MQRCIEINSFLVPWFQCSNAWRTLSNMKGEQSINKVSQLSPSKNIDSSCSFCDILHIILGDRVRPRPHRQAGGEVRLPPHSKEDRLLLFLLLSACSSRWPAGAPPVSVPARDAIPPALRHDGGQRGEAGGKGRSDRDAGVGQGVLRKRQVGGSKENICCGLLPCYTNRADCEW